MSLDALGAASFEGSARLERLAASLADAAAFVHAQALVVSAGLGLDWQGRAATLFATRLQECARELAACSHSLGEDSAQAGAAAAALRLCPAWGSSSALAALARGELSG